MTGKTAQRFDIKDRGFIKIGQAADICVFNFEEIKVNTLKPSMTPSGIKHVIINGKLVLNNNIYNGKTAGIVLYK